MTVKILIGDVRDQLRHLEPDSFDCVVTSPPYWGLRDYGVEGQIGLEPTLGEHLAVMVDVMEEVRRVLKPSGTLWLNYGDCYATSPNGRSAADTKAVGNDDRTFRDKPFSTIGPIYNPEASTGGYRGGEKNFNQPSGRIQSGGLLKPKDLCMVPNRLAIALQEAGWWVRSEIIWAKPNPMPESVNDRPASAHEKIFLLSKAPRYFYDTEAVRQNLAPSSVPRLAGDIENQAGSSRGNGGKKLMKAVGGRASKQSAIAAAAAAAGGSSGRRMGGFNERWDQKEKMRSSDLGPRHVGQIGNTGIDQTPRGEGRNLRNYEPAPVQVWTLATQPFSEAHFATFPPDLAARALTAGCPPGGSVLDPFGGAGTVGLVSEAMGLDCTLIELNPEYAKIAANRIRAAAVKNEVVGVDHQDQHSGLPLFKV